MYTPHTAADIEAMLGVIGVSTLDELVKVPEALAARALPDVVPKRSELELAQRFSKLASAVGADSYRSFLGGGAYRHYVPPVVGSLAMRGEFLTSYTPYQAEASQGYLQAIYEWQTYIALLTGLDVANASVYDGATALAEASIMAINATGRRAILISSALHPNYQSVLRTYARGLDLDVDSLPYGPDGATDTSSLATVLADQRYAAVVIQSPNFFGAIDDLPEAAQEVVRSTKTLLIGVTAEALALAVLAPPASWAVDIAVGEAQSFGNAIAFGGPHLGFIATTNEQLRRIPGRLVGRTVDSCGTPAYVLTLQAREQHIRRERATSNICTNQAHCALVATIYLAALGASGLKTAAAHNIAQTNELRHRLTSVDGFSAAFSAPTFNEFVLRTPGTAADWLARLRRSHILGGIDLGRFYPELADCVLVTATELTSTEDIDVYAAALQKERYASTSV